MMMKYYAVKTSSKDAIFTDWDACLAFIKGKKGVVYKAFLTEEEAKEFIAGITEEPQFDLPTAYIDGSYDEKTGNYSFGGVLIVNNEIFSFSKKYELDEFSSARNVAGEIKGAGFIIQYCVNRGIPELNIVYDYVGIERWYNGAWKANSEIAKSYVAFANSVRSKIKVHFLKVKSHSNNFYNDQADLLAKKALGLD